MRALAILLLAVCSGVLAAQASTLVSGSVSDFTQRAQLFSVDFGGGPQSLQLDLSIAATSGTSGLGAVLFDLEEMAANGTATAIASGSDAGTGTINISLATGTYSGVVDFMLGVTTDSGVGTSPFSGTLSTATLASGAIALGAVQSVTPPVNSNVFVHGRILNGSRDAAAQVAFEFNVHFGATPQSITYLLQGGGSEGATIEVEELSDSGVALSSVVVADTVAFVEENNGTTTSRSGTVRFRITVTPAASGTFDWALVFPSTVSISALGGGGGGGGGGGDDSGCSSGQTGGIGLIALLGVLVAIRVSRGRKSNHG